MIDDVKSIVKGEPQVGSIGILYGAAHMPDLAERLASQLGYRPAGEQWITAFEVDVARSAVSEQQLQSIRRMVRMRLRQMMEIKGTN